MIAVYERSYFVGGFSNLNICEIKIQGSTWQSAQYKKMPVETDQNFWIDLTADNFFCPDPSESIYIFAFRMPGILACDPMPKQGCQPRPGILQIPVRAQQNGHGTGRRASATDQSLISVTGGSRSEPIVVRTRPLCKHRVRNSKMGLWHPALRPVPCPFWWARIGIWRIQGQGWNPWHGITGQDPWHGTETRWAICSATSKKPGTVFAWVLHD